MIRIVAKNVIKSEKIEEFIALAKKLVEETNQKDEGCIHYELYQDLANPQILTIMEEWESQAALENHMAASHFKEIVPQFADFAFSPGEVNIYKLI